MDIDCMVNKFRLASRELFNYYFRVADPYSAGSDAWACEERFRDVENILFQSLVTEPACILPVEYGDVQNGIGVELRFGDFSPILINRLIDSGCWDYHVKEINKDAKMVFINFFDWDQLDCRDNKYVHVKILDWPTQFEVIGKHALIESQYVKFSLISQVDSCCIPYDYKAVD